MKVYFSAALYQKDKYIDKYLRIVDQLKKNDCTVFEDTTTTKLEDALKVSDADRVVYYKKVLKWIDKCDFLVVEASFPSTLSIGHEITLALEKSKPVIVLYCKGAEPTFLLGLKDDRVIWAEYTDGTLEKVLKEAVDKAKNRFDVRFNFFVSPQILTYLDWVSQERMIPRSVFLRNLIEREMKKDKKFNSQ